jgi:acetyltransferase-like isoleucine patch superfamily enzyme
VIFLGGEHRPDWVTTYPFSEKWRCAKHYKGHPKTKGDVVIGHDVWIGSNATILSGVSIGSGAVIGCHAVVGRDVEPYSIVCGNPAKLIRKRFSDEVISQLLEINWWLWPREAVAEGMSMLLSNNVEEFIRYAMEEVRTMRDGGVFK